MIEINSNPIIQWAAWRIRKNKNVIIVINGGTGSGKTYAGLTIAHDFARMNDVPFSVKGNVGFDFLSLMKLMKAPEHDKPGVPYLFEEVGASGGGASSREWQSKANRLFFSFMQTARHRNQVLIFTCPHFSFLDAGSRALVHMQVSMQEIDFKNNVSYGRPYVLQVNPRTGQIYFKCLRLIQNRQKIKLKMQAFQLPPKEMIDEYERAKTQFTGKLIDRIIAEGTPKPINKIKAPADMQRLSKLSDAGFNNTEISQMMGVSSRHIRRLKSSMKENTGDIEM